MRKKVFGRQFKRDTNERKALFKSLMDALVMHEAIQTTEPKAKAIKGSVEKLITKAKNRGEEARQFLTPYVSSSAVEKIIKVFAPLFAKRPGGYTRIVKLSNRLSDNAHMVLLEWVEKPVKQELVITKEDKKTKVPEAKKSPLKKITVKEPKVAKEKPKK